MKVDYIIVGCGLAGIAFCEELRKNSKSYVVYNDASQQSSKVAGGLFNPVVLKRFTAAWQAKKLIEMAMPFYSELEEYLKIKIVYKTPIFRIFNSIEEQNDWFSASDKPILSEFLSEKIHQNKNPEINAEYGMGEVLKVGRIDTSLLIDTYLSQLGNNDRLISEPIDYGAIEIIENEIKYKNVTANRIVFTDGFGLKQNPFFNYLPLVGNKGEYILIKASKLKLQQIIKGSIFIIPKDEDLYLVGATYNNEDKTNAITSHAKEQLITKLKKIVNCDFTVVGQVAGVRPTVKDRRPLVGSHPIHNRVSLINGLGTRGVLASPYLGNQLFRHLNDESNLDLEIDIKRFQKLFTS